MKMQGGETYKPLLISSAGFYRLKTRAIFKKLNTFWNTHNIVSKLFPIGPQDTTLFINGKPTFRVIELMFKNAKLLGRPFHMFFGKGQLLCNCKAYVLIFLLKRSNLKCTGESHTNPCLFYAATFAAQGSIFRNKMLSNNIKVVSRVIQGHKVTTKENIKICNSDTFLGQEAPPIREFFL